MENCLFLDVVAIVLNVQIPMVYPNNEQNFELYKKERFLSCILPENYKSNLNYLYLAHHQTSMPTITSCNSRLHPLNSALSKEQTKKCSYRKHGNLLHIRM